MSDNNWQSYYGDNPDTSGFVNPENPKDYDDILKFSNCTNVYVTSKFVAAGRENCVDAVRGNSYTFSECVLADGAGVSTVTIKGSINGWNFEGCTIGKGKETDIEVGQFDNYWYPGRAPTRQGSINHCISTDGSPIKITCWDADKPLAINSNVNIVKIPWIIWFPYFCFRYICVHWFSKI